MLALALLLAACGTVSPALVTEGAAKYDSSTPAPYPPYNSGLLDQVTIGNQVYEVITPNRAKNQKRRATLRRPVRQPRLPPAGRRVRRSVQRRHRRGVAAKEGEMIEVLIGSLLFFAFLMGVLWLGSYLESFDDDDDPNL